MIHPKFSGMKCVHSASTRDNMQLIFNGNRYECTGVNEFISIACNTVTVYCQRARCFSDFQLVDQENQIHKKLYA